MLIILKSMVEEIPNVSTRKMGDDESKGEGKGEGNSLERSPGFNHFNLGSQCMGEALGGMVKKILLLNAITGDNRHQSCTIMQETLV